MNDHRFAIEYGPSALDDLDRLPARERAQILRKIERLRMGDYRALFDVAGAVILIRRVGNRKDVYD